ncbi:MAG: YifB family Mg chelatase-like AAA ATPase [Clostridiales bacterium]|jgi:magnesium chelatase family protein|nr:YifB family Mg chelatase-like AAA ATPase [Clostridiales bacterium]
MIAKIISGALNGIDGIIVTVEVDMCGGIPGIDIVGLPDSAIKESKERVRTALRNSGFTVPSRRITVNLAPANTRKEGAAFDLPIAVGILACMGVIDYKEIENYFMIGELSLDGLLKPVNGVLSLVHCAFKNNIKKIILSDDNSNEASLIEQLDVFGVDNLKNLVDFLNNKKNIEKTKFNIEKNYDENILNNNNNKFELDFCDVRGQESAKRAIEIAAAGNHNLLMIGPPGSGKTMIAKRLPNILSKLTFEESIDVTKIYSISGLLKNKNILIDDRPFRSPHHTISYSALTGGGRIPKPGEISLSHKGILFLDELPEFQNDVLEILRQPLEDKTITISRVNATVTYPADFMLVASMNPCPCGYFGSGIKCNCKVHEISRYINKISGPLLDRIDIQIEVSNVDYNDLSSNKKSISTSEIKKRVLKAQKIQKDRYSNIRLNFNSQLNCSQTEAFCILDKESKNILKQAFKNLNLSARAYDKILKISRTIADLDESKKILFSHVAEAIQYRTLDRKYWK